MKISLKNKGFTLVEIMIVVVIIGLLSAIAVPSFKKVRNKSIENTLIYDGKQLASAACIFMTENPTSTVPVARLANAIPRLSSGVEILTSSPGRGEPITPARLAPNEPVNTATGDFGRDGYFVLAHNTYDRAWSTSGSAAQGFVTTNSAALQFSVATGLPERDPN